LGTKVSAIVTSVIATLAIVIGVVIFQTMRNNHIEMLSEKMNESVDKLYSILETENQIRNELISTTISSLRELQSQADMMIMQPMVEEPEIFDDLAMEPAPAFSVEPLINSLQEKAAAVDMEFIERQFSEIKYFENGYPVIVDQNGILLVHPTQKGADISATRLFEQIRGQDQGVLSYRWPEQGADQQNKQIYFVYYEPFQWYVGATIYTREAINQPMAEARATIFLLMIPSIIIFIFLIVFLMKIITKPINNIADIIKRLSKGLYVDNIVIDRGDEIGEIYRYLQSLLTGLKETAIFANEIEKKNFEYKFSPLSEEDALGNALLDMRNSLMKAQQEEESRRIEDKKRNWATEGLARFSDILRQNNENLEVLSFNIIKNLVKYLNINQGGIFILNDEDRDNRYLELTACYAFNRQKFLTKTIQIGEGITGTCFLEQETIYLKELPQDYISITSGLGDAAPSSLLLVPLKLNEKVYGVLELASFNEFAPHEVEFVEKIAESIASTIAGVKTNLRTAQLLEQSQQQTEEMKAQEEEMRQNMEEMQSTQEELQRRSEDAKRIQEELDKESSLLKSFLESSEDTIYFKDKDSKFIRVSDSLLKVWNMSDQKEAIGISDFDLTSYEQAKPKFDVEQEIIRTGKPINIEEQDVRPDGSIRWISTIKMPLRNQNGEITGTFGISRNITELKNTLEKAISSENELKEKILEVEKLKRELAQLRESKKS